MQTANYMTPDEVALAIGWSRITFQRKYQTLVQTRGFPLRMPGGNFYRPAIERWMAAASGMAPEPTPEPLADQRAHLKVIYGGRA